MIKQIVILLFLFFTSVVFSIENTNEQALVDIKVGVELTKLEASATSIDHSIKLAAQALQEMASHPNMDKEQQAKIIATLAHIDKLSATFQETIKEIPTVITQSTPPVLAAIDNLFSNVQLTIILVLVAIVLLLIIALIAIYYWVLKPTTTMILKTTSKVDNLATALQTTAKIVEKNVQQQLLILNHRTLK
jgi:hypothetical protein